jgi:hypothetical protein
MSVSYIYSGASSLLEEEDSSIVTYNLLDGLNEQAKQSILAAAVSRRPPEPPDYSNFILVDGKQYLLKSFGKLRNQRFINEFKPYFGIVNESDIDEGSFLITRKEYNAAFGDQDAETIVDGYLGIEEEEIVYNDPTLGNGVYRTRLTYSYPEGLALLMDYSEVDLERSGDTLEDVYVDSSLAYAYEKLQLQVSITSEPGRNEGNLQNSTAEPELISYDALSSLGSINQENVTISSTTTGTGEAIGFGTGQITDIGGTSLQTGTTRENIVGGVTTRRVTITRGSTGASSTSTTTIWLNNRRYNLLIIWL